MGEPLEATQNKRRSRSVSKKKVAQVKAKVVHKQRLKTIVVTGSRRARQLRDTVLQTEVITRKQIVRLSAVRLSEALETHLGVQVNLGAGAGASLQIQGLESKHILVLLDGHRINGRVDGVLDLDRFPLEQIERIEIVKGATSALYGSDAIGGVINIITRKPKQPFSVNFMGQYGYGDSHLVDLSGSVGFRVRGWSGLLSLSWFKHENWDIAPGDIATTGGDDSQFQVSGRTSYRFSKKVKLSIKGGYQLRDRASVDLSKRGGTYDRTNKTETGDLSISLNALLGGLTRLRWKTGITHFRDRYRNAKRNSKRVAKPENTYDWIMQSVAQLDIGIGNSHVISAGIDGTYERIESDRIKQGSANRGRIALFAQYEWMLHKPIRISVVPGLRVGYDTQYSFSVNPKLSFRIDPVKSLAFRASYGWGFRAPDFKELYLQFALPGVVVSGNPLLQPEYARSLQVGVEWSKLRWLILRANFYRNDLNNLINKQNSMDGRTLLVTFKNVDAAITQGFESQVVLSYQKYIQFSVGYTYLWSEDLATKKPLLERAAHKGNVQFFGQIPNIGLRLSIRGTLIGPRDVMKTTTQREVLPAYLLLHARLSYLFWKRRVELFASLNNIANVGMTQWLPIRPRTFYAGVRLRN